MTQLEHPQPFAGRRSISHGLLLILATAGLLLVLDLTFLGWLAKGFYDDALGPLRRPSVHGPAAALFYVLYLGFVLAVCILPSASTRQAAARGASLGLLSYATFELTAWAVLAAWPAALVPVDIAWGVALTATVAGAGKWVDCRLQRRTQRIPRTDRTQGPAA